MEPNDKSRHDEESEKNSRNSDHATYTTAATDITTDITTGIATDTIDSSEAEAAQEKESGAGAETIPLATALPEREDAKALTVVGLGGSAGSIAAMQAFFENVRPSATGHGSAYVVVLHLSAEYESHLTEVLGRSTSLPVHQVTETVPIQADHVYVIPPGKALEMRDGTLILSDPEKTPGRRVVIDIFFRTLAEAHGPQAAAIVFSGTGADGTLGIRQIKESGGLVVTQSPLEAEYDAMPRSAIATGMVDYVLPSAGMPAQIATYWETSRLMRIPQDAAPATEQREEGSEQEVALHEILTHARVQTGHDFALYKRATVLRRIGRRMQVNGLQSLPEYRDYLQTHPAEVDGLIGDLLISVTQFFRDPQAWAALERDFIPQLFASKMGSEANIRVWVCGCATGEEAYTLAILLLEQAERMPHPPTIQIFATDMDTPAIAQARAGIYPETIAADLSEERLRRWFYWQNGAYQVRKEVRETVLFAHHDVLRDTPFSRLDLITCRNLLIYLNREAQERIFRTFHFALRPDATLMLGPSETAEGEDGVFHATNKNQRLFIRRAVPRSALLSLPAPLYLPNFARNKEAEDRTPLAARILPPSAEQAPKEASAREAQSAQTDPLSPFPLSLRAGKAGDSNFRDFLPRYGPPFVVVNQEYTIVHLSGAVANFLRFPNGEPTFNLLELVPPSLRPELRGALFGAIQEGIEQTRVVLNPPSSDGQENSEGPDGLVAAQMPSVMPTVIPAIRLSVRPVPLSPSDVSSEAARGGTYFVVQFDTLSEAFLAAIRPIVSLEPLSESDSTARSAAAVAAQALAAATDITRRLEQENTTLQREVLVVSERYDAVTEELKASNEEMQATNEEMRSVVEELETGKEELQSVNEELSTVNYELKARVEELTSANSDLSNFLGATDMATLFLDRNLNVKRFTPAALALFNLIPTDVGRPLAHITNRLDYSSLKEDADAVLLHLIPVEREVRSTDGQRVFWARLLPYRNMEDRIDGVVVTFVDITARKKAEEELGAAVQTIAQAKDQLEVRVQERTRELSERTRELFRMGEMRQELMGRLVTAQEEERARMARDLHDDTGQQITGLLLNLGNLRNLPAVSGDATVQDLVDLLYDLADDIAQKSHRIALNLRPTALDDIGLMQALKNYAEQWSQWSGLTLNVEGFGVKVEAGEAGRLAPAVETTIYRIVQEALTNVLRHAAGSKEKKSASRVSVIVQQRENNVLTVIEDDGPGFDVEAALSRPAEERRLGLFGMQERARLAGGTLEIESTLGEGTTIYLRIPV